MPRTERLAEIASAKGQATGDAVEQLAKLSNLPLIEDIQLVDNPTAVLPLRLINATNASNPNLQRRTGSRRRRRNCP